MLVVLYIYIHSTMMKWYKILFLITTQNWIAVVGEVLCVLPDNSTNVIYPSQPCATLSQYWLDSTLPVVLIRADAAT